MVRRKKRTWAVSPRGRGAAHEVSETGLEVATTGQHETRSGALPHCSKAGPHVAARPRIAPLGAEFEKDDR